MLFLRLKSAVLVPILLLHLVKKARTFNLTLREEIMETSVPLFLTSPGTSNEIPQPQNESNTDCVVCFSWSLTQNLTAPFYNLRCKKNSSIALPLSSINIIFLINTKQWRLFSPFALHTDSVFWHPASLFFGKNLQKSGILHVFE